MKESVDFFAPIIGEPKIREPENLSRKNVDIRSEKVPEVLNWKYPIVWRNVLAFTYLHLGLFYSIYLGLSGQFKIYTHIFGEHFSNQPKDVKLSNNIPGIFAATTGALVITAGAHRLWSHKSYNAKLPLRILLMTM